MAHSLAELVLSPLPRPFRSSGGTAAHCNRQGVLDTFLRFATVSCKYLTCACERGLWSSPYEGCYCLWIIWENVPVKETFTTPIRLYTEVVLMFPDYILHDRGVSVLCLTVPLMMGFAEVKYRNATKLRVLPRRYGQDDVHGVQKGTSPYRGGEARVARAPSSTKPPAS